ncbi:Mobile element protein [Sphingobium indicum BiD32]|uniref:Mobile element protein n=1 Tax=Sphingobium indicum BiD32 TaxID=1301087 RepID=N1MSQ3_9SPHN|nr:Mobile element protein [Sphingobium indicum BiD32]
MSLEALPDDPDALKVLLISTRAELLQAEALAAIAQAQVTDAYAVIEELKLRTAKARQDKWGQSSERHKHLLDQLEMQLEDVVTSATEDELAAELAVAKAGKAGVPVAPFTRKRAARRPLSSDLPRHRVVVPGPQTCSCCQGSDLKKIGESVTESREVIPRQWIVLQTVREKFVCRDCTTISQTPAPFHPVPRGSVGPKLLAMIAFNKFGLHQPLNRQSETYAAEGMDISVSTLADMVGHATILLNPLLPLLEDHVLAGLRIHHDDMTVPVIAAGKTITGRVWASVRDDRPFGGGDPPGVMFYYTRDRTGAHPQRQLPRFTGILQADAYTGYEALYAPGRKLQPILEAACWAHARRPFYKEARLKGSPLAREIVKRMDAVVTAERQIWGRSADERLEYRQRHVASLVAELEAHLRQQYRRVSRKSDLAKAISYMVSRWESFARFLHDGRICMTNNAAERRVRTVAIGRKNWTFCGSDRGGHRAAAMYSLIQTCRLNGVDPHAWLRDVIASISDQPQNRLHGLLPWNWCVFATRLCINPSLRLPDSTSAHHVPVPRVLAGCTRRSGWVRQNNRGGCLLYPVWFIGGDHPVWRALLAEYWRHARERAPVRVHLEQLVACCDQRANQHAVKALYPHLAVKADLGKVRESVRVICIGLVRRHIQRRLGMAGMNANRRQAFQLQRMIEPDRQRPRLEHDALRVRSTLADHLCYQFGIGQRQIRLPASRTETNVSFNDTARPINCFMVVSRSMLGPAMRS